MSSAATLSVRLTARTASFEHGMKRAASILRSFDSTSNRVLGSVVKLGSALGAVGVGFFLKKTSSAINNLSKMSDRLNISTKDLTRLEHAAGLSGLSIEELEKSIRNLQTRISEAGQLKTTRRLFDALKIDPKQFALLDQKTQLFQVADAMGNVANQTDRMRIARELFGRAGDKMLNLFKDGAAGLRDMGREADAAGFSFNRLSGVKVEAALDAMERLKNVVRGVGRQIVIALSPFVANLADRLFEVVTQSDNVSKAMTAAFEFTTTGILTAADAVDTLKIEFLKLQNVADDLAIGMVQTWKDAKTAIGGFFNAPTAGGLTGQSGFNRLLFGPMDQEGNRGGNFAQLFAGEIATRSSELAGNMLSNLGFGAAAPSVAAPTKSERNAGGLDGSAFIEETVRAQAERSRQIAAIRAARAAGSGTAEAVRLSLERLLIGSAFNAPRHLQAGAPSVFPSDEAESGRRERANGIAGSIGFRALSGNDRALAAMGASFGEQRISEQETAKNTAELVNLLRTGRAQFTWVGAPLGAVPLLIGSS